MLRKLRPLFLTILSAIFLALPYINGKLWIFAWFGFTPLLFAIKKESKGKAFLLSYLAGVIFWLLTIYWLVHVTLPGTIVLILYLALYFGAFGLIASIYLVDARFYAVLLIPSIWVLLEYLRSHLLTGFPWALLAYSQYKNLPIIQIIDTTGAWGVSFLIIVINIAIYSAFSSRFSAPGFKRKYLLPILCMLIVLSYGYYKIYQTPDTRHQTPIKISVIQGNIPQELKWDPSAESYILNQYEQLSKDAASEHPDLIVWPEASSPGLLGEDNSVFREIFSLARDIRVPLLIGTVARDRKEYFNSCLLINSAGEISGRYDKLHLVPFGEYIPFKKYLPFLETIVPIGDINEGREYTIFQIPNPKSRIPNKFAVLICFEDLFPELSRKFIQGGAQILVNITNDAWYKQTSAPYQHLQASVFRAIENRVFLARAANTGISGFIDPSGRIISLVRNTDGKEIFSTGYKTQEIVILKHGPTFYNRFGDYFVLICFLFIPRGLKPRPSWRG